MKQNWVIAGAAAAMLAAATGAGAQTTPGSANSMSSMPMSSSMAMGSTPNYGLLADKTLDYTELKAAKAKGLSDREVATCYKIAWETRQPLHDVVDAALRGETFAHMASAHGLSLANVMDVDAEQSKINDYMAAYESTGWMGMKGGSMSAPTMPMNMGGGTQGMSPSSSTPMAPMTTPRSSSGPMTPDTSATPPAGTGAAGQ